MCSSPRTEGGAAAGGVEPAAAGWYVYILLCADGSLYTGIARDVARRVAEHNGSDLLAANYTRARRPVTLVYQEAADSRSAAGKREFQIKQLTRRQKQALIGAAAR
jgi:putative endonuclease